MDNEDRTVKWLEVVERSSGRHCSRLLLLELLFERGGVSCLGWAISFQD